MARVHLESQEYRRYTRLPIPRRDSARTPLCSPVTHVPRRSLAVLQLECPCCSSAPFQSRSSASAPRARLGLVALPPPRKPLQVAPQLAHPAPAVQPPSGRSPPYPQATPPIPAQAPLQLPLQLFF